MRVLFTTQPGVGHFHPLVPLARALTLAGHDVAVACSPAFCATVAASGLRAVPAGLDWLETETVRTFPEWGRMPGGQARGDWATVNLFAGATAAAMLPALLALAQTWPPEVIVRDAWEYGGCVAAEALGIPHATVQVGAFSSYAGRHHLLHRPLGHLRALAGLPPDPGLAMLYRYLHLAFVPPAFQDPAWPVPSTHQALRPIIFDASGDERLPAWAAELRPPTVYATLGTVNNSGLLGLFETILAAVSGLDLTLVLTVGRNVDPARFGAQPRTVHIERYIPQTLVLPFCDLVITHGGFNTVLAALAHGLPLVVIPIGADQPENARRCAALGVAKVVPPDDRTPGAIRAAVKTVLADPTYRQNAQRLRAAIDTLPPRERGVALLENLVGEHQASVPRKP